LQAEQLAPGEWLTGNHVTAFRDVLAYDRRRDLQGFHLGEKLVEVPKLRCLRLPPVRKVLVGDEFVGDACRFGRQDHDATI